MEIDNQLNESIRKIISHKYNRSQDDENSLKLKVESGSKKGDNYLGVILCVNAKFCEKNKSENEESETELDLIVKKAPESLEYRKMFPIEQAFAREVYVYTNVLPAFIKFQQEFGVKNLFNSYAEFYEFSLKTGKEYLIMANMKSQNYWMCNRKEAMDLKHSLLVFRELGRLHALSFAMKSKHPETFSQMSKNCREIVFSNCDMTEMSQSFEMNRKLIIETFDSRKDQAVINKLNQFFDRGFRLVVDLIQPEAAGDYTVIVHGDTWINNLLFSYKDLNNNSPDKLCFLDWQLSRLGSPLTDLVYYLFICTDQEIRGENLKVLFEEYHKSLAEMLAEFGCSADKLFPFKVMMDQYHKFAAYGLAMATIITRLIVSESEEIPDFVDLCEKQAGQTKSFDFSSKNHHLYSKRMHDLAIYCANENLI